MPRNVRSTAPAESDMARKKPARKSGNGANLGFEEKLWAAADKMRGHIDAAEYKHVVLGLIFLKYISDAFDERRAMLEQLASDPASDWYVKEPSQRYEVMEDRDEYIAESVFWVPKVARWEHLQANAPQPTIGKLLDEAMVAIEKDNPVLKGVLPKDYARPSLDKHRLGELINLIGTIGLGNAESRSKDILGRVYDPCCGSGGMFVQSEKFVLAHGGRVGDLSIYGQESNNTTWRLCKMNLAIRGIEGNIGPHQADTFHNDVHKDLKADFILANPPFNVSDWGGDRLREDTRWKYGTPPVGNANFAWVQHMVHHLAPSGIAGFVLANGSMSSNQSGEGEIRRKLIEADLVDCMIALPGQLFYTTQIPACLWFLARSKKNGKFRDRRGQTLFIDARKMGALVDRTHRDLTDDDIQQIAKTYHAWRGEKGAGKYADVPGFCKSATLDEILSHGHVLTPGRYVGAAELEEDDEPFDEKMQRLTNTLARQFKEGAKLEKAIMKNLSSLGFSPKESP